MSEILKLEIQTICIVHIIAIIVAIVFFMIFYIKAYKDIAVRWFLVMQGSIIGWMIFKIFKTVSPTEAFRWYFVVGYYICTCIFEVSFLEFGYSYYKGKAISNRIRRLIYIFPILQIILIITNPYHYLFYERFDFWGDSFGNLFYWNTGIVYGFVVTGFVYGVLKFRKEYKNEKSWYKYLTAFSIVLPLIFNFLYITRRLQHFIYSIGIPIIFDITPIVFTWCILAFVNATFNHDFFSLSPIMNHEIVHKLDTPICILDLKYRVVYINEKLDGLFENDSIEIINEILGKIGIRHMEKAKTLKREVKIDNKNISVFAREVSSLLQTRYLITIKDISSYRQIEEEIKKSQKKLLDSNNELEKNIDILKKTSIAGARNYVAKELHDIIGHSLVVTIKLLEVARLYIDKDKELVEQSLSDAVMSLDMGIISMASITIEKEKNYSGKQLEADIKKMLVSVNKLGIRTTFKLRGIMYNVAEVVYDVIKKVCMELVTNALKHSEASGIFIAINISESNVNLIVMDNGKGVKKIVKGNGLKGIEDRLRSVGGTIEYNTNDGFLANVNI